MKNKKKIIVSIAVILALVASAAAVVYFTIGKEYRQKANLIATFGNQEIRQAEFEESLYAMTIYLSDYSSATEACDNVVFSRLIDILIADKEHSALKNALEGTDERVNAWFKDNSALTEALAEKTRFSKSELIKMGVFATRNTTLSLYLVASAMDQTTSLDFSNFDEAYLAALFNEHFGAAGSVLIDEETAEFYEKLATSLYDIVAGIDGEIDLVETCLNLEALGLSL